jgi:hypothetical protein
LKFVLGRGKRLWEKEKHAGLLPWQCFQKSFKVIKSRN